MVPGGELVEVATGTVIQPKERTMHHSRMDENVMKVRLANVVLEYHDFLPPSNLRAVTRRTTWSLETKPHG